VAEKAAVALASEFLAHCGDRFYTFTEYGTIREYRSGLKLELFIAGVPSPSGVTEADILNGIRWRGHAEFGLGKSGRSIQKDGTVSEWKSSSYGMKFNFSFRDGKWQILDEYVTSNLYGDFRTLLRGLTCDQVRQQTAIKP